MSEITVGTVGVEVVPTTRKFASKLRSDLDPEAAKIGREFGQLFGEAAERQMAEGVKEGLREGARTAEPDGLKAGRTYGAAVKRGVQAATKDPAVVKIDADIKAAQARVKELRAFAEKKLQIDADVARLQAKLAALQSRGLKIDADVKAAEVKLEELRRQAEKATGDRKVKVEADIGAAQAKLAQLQATKVSIDADTAAANGKLAALKRVIDDATSDQTVTVDANIAAAEAKLERLQAKRIEIEARVDVDTAGASAQLALMRGQALGVSSGMAALTASVGLLGAALIPVGAVGVGALGAIATGALAAASGIGVLLLALAPVIAAVQAVRQAHDQSAASARGSTNAHLQMAAAMDSVRSAQRALASAEEDARVSRVRAAEQIADAQRRLDDQVRQSARDQVEAARRVEDAERSLADAQRDSLKAIEALNDAREQAVRDQEDLASRVATGALDEREAVIRLAEAQEHLREVQQDPNATELDRRRAQLAVDEAIQGLKDQQTENRRLAEEKKKSDQEGIDGSKRVKDAQDQVRNSQERLRDAQRGVSDAVSNAAEVQRRSAERVADAQRALARAQQDASDSQRRSAEAIVSAQQAVISAQRGVQQASQSAGATGGAAMDKVREKMAALTPEGQRFARFITDSLLPAFGTLSNAAQRGFLPGFQRALESLAPMVPVLARFIEGLASKLGSLAEEAAQALGGPWWREFFGFVGDTAAPLLDTFARILGNVITGFAGLLKAFFPATDAFSSGLLELSRKFADFGKTADRNPGFQRFIQYIKDSGPKVVSTLGAIFGAAKDIVTALAPLGPVALSIVRGFANFVSVLPPRVIQAIAVGLVALAVAIGAVNVAIAVTEAVLAVIATGTIGLIVAGIAVAIGVIIAWALAFRKLYQENETFRRVVNAVWRAVQAVISFAWNQVILPVFRALSSFVTGTLIPVFQRHLLPTVQTVWQLIQIAVRVAWAAIQIALRAMEIELKILGTVFSDLYRFAIKPTWDLIRPIFTLLGSILENQVAPAFRRGVDAIGKAWDLIRDKAKAPVKFLVDTVVNKGIIGTFNKVAGYFHVNPVDPVIPPKGFAQGGILPGYTPGRDVHTFVSPTAGVLQLSGGEAVMRPEWVQAVGPGYVDRMNAAARAGRFGRRGVASGGILDQRSFFAGGVIGKIGHGLKDAASLVGNLANDVVSIIANPSDVLKGAVSKVKSEMEGAFGSSPWLSAITAVPGVLVDGMISKIKSLGPSLGGGGGAVSGAPLNPTGNQAIVKNIAAALYGWSGAEWNALYQVVMRESGFRNTAQNPTSTAYGMFQFLDSTWSTVGGHKTSDPTLQTQYGLRYIHDRYGDPLGALAHEHQYGWYDQGGYLPPGISIAVNGTGKPEPVLTAGQWSAMRSGGDGRPTVEVTQVITNPAPEVPSESLTRGLRKVAAFGLIPAGR